MIAEVTPAEIEEAHRVGKWRQDVHDKAGHQGPPILMPGADDLAVHIRGAIAELAASKHLGVDWSGRLITDFEEWQRYRQNGPDIGRRTQVRQTRIARGHLLLSLADQNQPTILAIVPDAVFHGCEGRVRLVGWAMPDRVRTPERWRVPPRCKKPCFWVPQRVLGVMGHEPRGGW